MDIMVSTGDVLTPRYFSWFKYGLWDWLSDMPVVDGGRDRLESHFLSRGIGYTLDLASNFPLPFQCVLHVYM